MDQPRGSSENLSIKLLENHDSVAKIKSILSSDEEVYYFLELVLDRGLGIVIQNFVKTRSCLNINNHSIAPEILVLIRSWNFPFFV
jgi:hypothetical protein